VNDRWLLSVVPHVMLIGPFDRNGDGGTVGVRATGTAVAGDDIRHAFLDGAVAAIPTGPRTREHR
jgi:hypothetical protein